ncbi:MAG TPA: CheB methylesterase domain-containing protein, partial [Mycobacteriales bacterium]|nr:CheB methylesterase domain-containing protein [Mycobacteriales bacterium]
ETAPAPVAAAVAAKAAERSAAPAVPRIASGEQSHVRLVVVGSSTGGPAALVSLLSGLPSDLPVPVLVVQHMSPGFVTGLASWLDEQVALPVTVGRSFAQLQPGTVTLAPDGENTTIDALLRVRLKPPAPGQLHVPSVDATFHSAASILGPMALGVLLTGMGRDGAAGLKAMHSTGAHTIAQDEASSVVWGMPGQAVSLGAAVEILPLDDIAASILTVIEEGES